MKAQHLPGLKYDLAAPSPLASLEKFWFAPADPTLLGFIRIVVGCVAFYTALTWGIGLVGYVGPNAWVDAKAAHYMTQEFPFIQVPSTWDPNSVAPPERGFYYASPFFHVTNPYWLWTIHLSILAVTFLFTIGYQTRLTAVLTWLGALCYIQRCQPMLFGADTMLNLLMIYLCIGPSGAALSLDRWLEVRRLRQLGVTQIEPPAPRASARVAMLLIQINFCIIYLASGASKLQGPTWWSGTALWGCFANLTFAPVASPWYVASLRLISSSRLLWEFVMSFGVIYTLLLEIGLPFLIWFPRFRWVCILGSILLHLGIGLFMGLPTFGILMMCMAVSFSPPDWFRVWLESWLHRDSASALRTVAPTPMVKAAALAATH